MKLLTLFELNKKMEKAGKPFADIYREYDYKNQCWLFELRGMSKLVRENYQTIEEIASVK